MTDLAFDEDIAVGYGLGHGTVFKIFLHGGAYILDPAVFFSEVDFRKHEVKRGFG
ncbi:hypothetical protein SDC9_172407 [bioreactor metagenome]|uniref:Uncharacterized protein n=1 Tax=bioreactor metagenome TaxID=1076179 RepID=A0A645GFW0_9ZZZZ